MQRLPCLRIVHPCLHAFWLVCLSCPPYALLLPLYPCHAGMCQLPSGKRSRAACKYEACMRMRRRVQAENSLLLHCAGEGPSGERTGRAAARAAAAGQVGRGHVGAAARWLPAPAVGEGAPASKPHTVRMLHAASAVLCVLLSLYFVVEPLLGHGIGSLKCFLGCRCKCTAGHPVMMPPDAWH